MTFVRKTHEIEVCAVVCECRVTCLGVRNVSRPDDFFGWGCVGSIDYGGLGVITDNLGDMLGF